MKLIYTIKISKLNTITFFYLLSSFLFSFNISAQQSVKSYVFGHSLFKHDFNSSDIETTNIPYWMNELANEAGNDYAINGQFGQPDYHEIPPLPGWGWDNITSAWNTDFATSDYDNVIVTEANFIQGLPPTSTETGFSRSSLDNFLRIFDYVVGETPDVKFYIYENWPEFGGQGFPYPPTPDEMLNYHNHTMGDFHDWWISLHDLMLAERPNSNIKLLPVGSILSKMLVNLPGLASLTHEDLYSDDAPHGHPVMYFLSALVHYMAMYQEQAPLTYNAPATKIPQEVIDNYAEIVNYIWTELQTVEFSDGESRVFYNEVSTSTKIVEIKETPSAFPNPSSGQFRVSAKGLIEISDLQGKVMYSFENRNLTNANIHIKEKGIYFIRTFNNTNISTTKIIIE